MTESLESVGGPLRPTSEDAFGRPPGTENRRAGTAALLGAALLAAATFLPWATYRPDVVGHMVTGWRDAAGGVGDGFGLAAVAIVTAIVAERCLAGRTGLGLQRWLWAASVAAVVVLVLSWWRVVDARDRIVGLTDGLVMVRPGWGLFVGLVGAALVALGARWCRVDPA